MAEQRAKVELFQSTPSVGRATKAVPKEQLAPKISIHALRGEGDFRPLDAGSSFLLFQSTPSVGRAT